MMRDCFLTHFFIGVTNRAKLIIRILKDIRINSTNAHAIGFSHGTNNRPIGCGIPRNMQCYTRTNAGIFLHLSRISKFFVNDFRRPRLTKRTKTRAAISQAPRWGFDNKVVQAFEERNIIHE